MSPGRGDVMNTALCLPGTSRGQSTQSGEGCEAPSLGRASRRLCCIRSQEGRALPEPFVSLLGHANALGNRGLSPQKPAAEN